MKKALLIIILITGGCSDQITHDRVTKLEARIAASEKATDFSNLEKRVSVIETDNWKKLMQDPKWISIDMTSHGYEKINTGLLPVLVSAVNAEPYLDGFRVTLAIANPYALTFQGLTIQTITHSVELGLPGNVVTNLDEYNASAKHRDFDQTEILYPGRWNNVSFELVPATAQELRTLAISLELKAIGATGKP